MTVEQEKKAMYLHNLVCGEGKQASNTVLNEMAYKRQYKDKPYGDSNTWDEFAATLDEGEEVLYLEWYFGPLAARGYFVAVDSEGKVTRQKLLWLS
jgi:hypothetical protein